MFCEATGDETKVFFLVMVMSKVVGELLPKMGAMHSSLDRDNY